MTQPIRRRVFRAVLGFGTLAAVAIVLAPLAGSTSISLRTAFDTSIPFSENVDAQIFFVARMPRILAGALVGQVFENSPASKAKLERGDVITKFDGKPIQDYDDLPRIVASTPPGSAVEVEVRRDGTTARILLRTEVPLEVGLANSIATRLHAVDATGAWPTSKLSVAVGTL